MRGPSKGFECGMYARVWFGGLYRLGWVEPTFTGVWFEIIWVGFIQKRIYPLIRIRLIPPQRGDESNPFVPVPSCLSLFSARR